MLPSELLARTAKNGWGFGPVAVDTETSGLHIDSGARISTVSVAWIENRESKLEAQTITGGTIDTWRMEHVSSNPADLMVGVRSMAWAFDQGVSGTGKPEDSGQSTLWPDAENLDEFEYEALLEWLGIVGVCESAEKALAHEALHDGGLIFHHAKFDIHMFSAGVRLWEHLHRDYSHITVWDTQNICDLLWGTKFGTTSLKPTAARLWGESEADEQAITKKYLAKKKLPAGRWDLMPWDIIAKYADQDARLTIRLYLRQIQELRSSSGPTIHGWLDGQDGRMAVGQAIERRLQTSKMLIRIERRGLPFAVDAAMEAGAELRRRAAALEQRLPFEPATLPMAKHYWFGKGTKNGVEGLDLAPYSRTDGGDPQMDVRVVTQMLIDEVPDIGIWRDIQKLQTADSKWYTGWAQRAGADNRLRTSVRQNGTVSMRFSVEGLQLQAIPHDYKLSGFEILNGVPTPRALIAAGIPDGWALWELDLKQAELRVGASMAGCVRMLELINLGVDLHADAAKEVFSKVKGDPDFDEYRQVSKRFNFSAIFGVGEETLQADVYEQTGILLSAAEAHTTLRKWNMLYPEFKRAIQTHSDRVQRRQRQNKGYGWLTTFNGERRWFRPGEDLHKAFNQRVQPSLAQFGISWWLEAERMLASQTGGGGMVLAVHDSIVALVPDDGFGQELVQRAADIGERLWGEIFPEVPGGVDIKPW